MSNFRLYCSGLATAQFKRSAAIFWASSGIKRLVQINAGLDRITRLEGSRELSAYARGQGDSGYGRVLQTLGTTWLEPLVGVLILGIIVV